MSPLALSWLLAAAARFDGPIPLEDLVRMSDVIGVGRIERVASIDAETIVDVKLDTLSKGSPTHETVRFPARRRGCLGLIDFWRVGDQAVFFLARSDRPDAKRTAIRTCVESGVAAETLESVEALRVQSVARIEWVDTLLLRLPPGLHCAESEGPFVGRSLRLSALTARVASYVEEQRGVWIEATCPPGRADEGWILTVRGDGDALLVDFDASGKHERRFALTWEARYGVSSLLGYLDLANVPDEVGDTTASGRRTLLTFGGRARTIVLPESGALDVRDGGVCLQIWKALAHEVDARRR
ncbi:MAG TPA: hypothetical protein VKE69_04295 [Planctomycetota bacterium]|nr:hypothetical protein [Planctomycetota bacterium]